MRVTALGIDEVVEPQTIFKGILERPYPIYSWGTTVKPVVAVRGTPGQGEMPHGGYRPFVIAACRRAFTDFRYTSLADGLNPGGRRGPDRFHLRH
jgi:hypothetical protein